MGQAVLGLGGVGGEEWRQGKWEVVETLQKFGVEWVSGWVGSGGKEVVGGWGEKWGRKWSGAGLDLGPGLGLGLGLGLAGWSCPSHAAEKLSCFSVW